LLFKFFLAVFFVNLILKSSLHFFLLGFPLVLNDILFITTTEDTSLFLKFDVHPVLVDAASSFKVREVIFGL
jgi:hypothetical protein